MAEITFGEAYGNAGETHVRVSPVHLVGGLVSLALIVGVCVWGGKIIMRDVSGIPVVQAMGDGPMRVAPEAPGGDVALHAGLTVNAVAAEGEAAPPEDRLVLAPQGADLAAEDLEVAPAVETEASAQSSAPLVVEDVETVASDSEAPLSADEVLALADAIAAEALSEGGPLDALSEAAAPVDAGDPVAAALAEAVAEAPQVTVISASIPGVTRSLRPWPRPGNGAVAVEASVQIPAPSATVEVTGALPAGTKLVQLGAYDSVALANADWQRISSRFADYMAGKTPVIQSAESGGRAFFRLRAQGFDDISDARRFCAVLMAENAACIPVVVR